MRLTSSPSLVSIKAERLIAGGRVILTAPALLSTWLELPQGMLPATVYRTWLLGYLLYGLVLLLFSWEGRLRSPRLILMSHLLDLLVFSLLTAISGGAASPLFIFFLFSIFCGALRWPSHGPLWTAVIALGLYNGQALLAARWPTATALQFDSLLIRNAYLAITALLLGHLTHLEQQLRRKLLRLVSWQDTPPPSADLPSRLHELLQQAVTIMETPQVLLLLDEPNTPSRLWMRRDGDQLTTQRVSADIATPVIPPQLAETDFLFIPDAAHHTVTIHTLAGGRYQWQGVPWHGDLTPQLSTGSGLCLQLVGNQVSGRLFLFGRAGLNPDDLYLGQLVARQIAVALGHHFGRQQLQHLVQAEERIRLARDLHDGVLQSLTGLALQLELLRRSSHGDASLLRQRIGEVQTLIADEQRALRTLIRLLKPEPSRDIAAGGQPAALQDLAASIERQWGIHVTLDIQPDAAHLPPPQAIEVRFLLLEALANGAKHARASQLRVQLAMQGEWLIISVQDNGRGFPFLGRHDLQSLQAMGVGPRSLMERISAQGGQLTLESGHAGSTLEMRLSRDWPHDSAWPIVASREAS